MARSPYRVRRRLRALDPPRTGRCTQPAAKAIRIHEGASPWPRRFSSLSPARLWHAPSLSGSPLCRVRSTGGRRRRSGRRFRGRVGDVSDPTLAEAVSAKCLPSVAAIDVYTSQASGYQGIYGYGTGSQSGSGDSLVQSSLGSGVVLSADGYVITNYHVVEGGNAYKVTVSGETYDAELVGSDPQL